MKVVQINAVYEYSSTGRTTMEMHEYLISLGIDSLVFCMNKDIPSKQIYRVGNRAEMRIHSLMSHLFDVQGLCSQWSTKKVLSQLEKINPDIVILRNLHSNYINYPMILKYLAANDIPTIIVLHDVWTFTGHCCYYTEDKCDKWLTECGNCPAKRKYNGSFLLDRSTPNFRTKLNLLQALPRLAVVGVSEWVTNEGRRSPIFAKANEILRIYNWIDLKKFKPVDGNLVRDKLGLGSRFTVLSVVQGWCEAKGLLKIIEAARRLPEDRFVLVGKMDYEGVLPDNVISVGVTSSTTELAEYYSMADVLLVCSIQETFGKVSAEALACGTPVISTNTTASPEIAGEECGFCFSIDDIDGMVSKINQYKHKGGKSAYKDKCRGRAERLFNKDTQMASYIQLFNRLLQIR